MNFFVNFWTENLRTIHAVKLFHFYPSIGKNTNTKTFIAILNYWHNSLVKVCQKQNSSWAKLKIY